MHRRLIAALALLSIVALGAPARANGYLEVVSDKPGVTVTINGEFRGETPLSRVELPDGEHTLLAEKKGYEPLEMPILIQPETPLQLRINLMKPGKPMRRHTEQYASMAPAFGAMLILLEDTSTVIEVDGRGFGTGSQLIERLTPGYHRVQFGEETIMAPVERDETTVLVQEGSLLRLETEEERAKREARQRDAETKRWIAGRFRLHGEVAEDRARRLIWQRDADDVLMTWPEARAHCAAYNPPGHEGEWRLPARQELESIVVRHGPGERNHIVNGYVFEGVGRDSLCHDCWFWTDATLDDEAWYINLQLGRAIRRDQGQRFQALCVKSDYQRLPGSRAAEAAEGEPKQAERK